MPAGCRVLHIYVCVLHLAPGGRGPQACGPCAIIATSVGRSHWTKSACSARLLRMRFASARARVCECVFGWGGMGARQRASANAFFLVWVLGGLDSAADAAVCGPSDRGDARAAAAAPQPLAVDGEEYRFSSFALPDLLVENDRSRRRVAMVRVLWRC